jgi:hypothetical protein
MYYHVKKNGKENGDKDKAYKHKTPLTSAA